MPYDAMLSNYDPHLPASSADVTAAPIGPGQAGPWGPLVPFSLKNTSRQGQLWTSLSSLPEHQSPRATLHCPADRQPPHPQAAQG